MTTCRPTFVLGVDAYTSLDCSVIAECIADRTNNTRYCTCEWSQNLLVDGAVAGVCKQSAGSWVVFALHLVLAILSLPVFFHLLGVLRTHSPRLELLRDALRLSVMATACLVVRCVAVSAQIATLDSAGQSGINLVFGISTVFLFFAFAISSVIYALVVMNTMQRLHNIGLLTVSQRKTERRSVFFQALAFALVSCFVCGVPYLMELYVASNLAIVLSGVVMTALYSIAYFRIVSLLQQFKTSTTIALAFDPLRRTVLFVLITFIVFTGAAVVYLTAQFVGHKQHHINTVRYASCIALLTEYLCMFFFQLCMSRVAHVVVDAPDQQAARASYKTSAEPVVLVVHPHNVATSTSTTLSML